jgi:hypothetical protein
MKSLLLFIIALALTPTSYAAQKIDRDNYYYFCEGAKDGGRLIFSDKAAKNDTKNCSKLEKGDVLHNLDVRLSVLYCDEDHLILQGELSRNTRVQTYTCIYNGKPIKTVKDVNNIE